MALYVMSQDWHTDLNKAQLIVRNTIPHSGEKTKVIKTILDLQLTLFRDSFIAFEIV